MKPHAVKPLHRVIVLSLASRTFIRSKNNSHSNYRDKIRLQLLTRAQKVFRGLSLYRRRQTIRRHRRQLDVIRRTDIGTQAVAMPVIGRGRSSTPQFNP